MSTWTRTRIGGETRDDDWSVTFGVHRFCRVYQQVGGPQDRKWHWTASWDRQLGSGYEDSREAAMAAAREAVERAAPVSPARQ